MHKREKLNTHALNMGTGRGTGRSHLYILVALGEFVNPCVED
jgi:hypothetical protein